MLVSQGARHTYEIQRDQHNFKCFFDFPVQHTATSCIGNGNNSADSVSTEELREHGLYSDPSVCAHKITCSLSLGTLNTSSCFKVLGQE